MDVCNRSLETVRHSRNLGMEVLSAEEDGVRVRLPWREDLVGNPDTGVLHGGAIFAMMDQAGGMANSCRLYPNFEITPTIDFRVDHLHAPTPGKAVICYATSYGKVRLYGIEPIHFLGILRRQDFSTFHNRPGIGKGVCLSVSKEIRVK